MSIGVRNTQRIVRFSPVIAMFVTRGFQFILDRTNGMK